MWLSSDTKVGGTKMYIRVSGRLIPFFVPAADHACLTCLLKPLMKFISVFMERNSGTAITIPGKNWKYGFNAFVKVKLNVSGLISTMTGKALR